MATFAKSTFSHAGYAASRPSYPQRLYDIVLGYHKGSNNVCIDIGTGHGVVARALAPSFKQCIGVDPSAGMLSTAKSSTPTKDFPNITYAQGLSENLPASVKDGSVDLIVAAQAAHWFDYGKTWPVLNSKLAPGGTIAFWGYSDIFLPEFPRATEKLHAASYGPLNQYWQRPGRDIVEGRLMSIDPAPEYFTDVEKIEYIPAAKGKASGQGELLMGKEMTVSSIHDLFRTWSSFANWKEANPEGTREREGDFVDWLFEDVARDDEAFKDPAQNIWVEWGTGVILARKR